MEKLDYEREAATIGKKAVLKDSEYMLIKAIENLTEAINGLRLRNG